MSASRFARIRAGEDIVKPGWVRLNFSVLMSDDKVDTIIAGVDALAREAAALQDCYDADIANSRFAWRGESKGLHEVA